MRKGVSNEGAGIPGDAAEPTPALTLSGDDMRAFLTFCLAASLLAVYTFAWATGLSS